MYTLADAVRLKEHVVRTLGGGRPRSVADRRRRAERRRRRRRPDRRRVRRGAGRAVPQQLRQGLPGDPAGEGAPDPGRGGPGRCSRCSSRTSAATRRRRCDERDVEVLVGRERDLRRTDTRDPEVRHGDRGPHAGLGRRPARRRRSSSRSGSTWRTARRIAVAPDLSIPGHPEVFAVGDIASITEGKKEILPQLGSVALQSGECAGENIARRVAGRADDAVRVPATRARWRPSGAAPRSCSSAAAAP